MLEVMTLPGEVIKPDSWKCINEEGMPVHGRPYEKGNLYIRFSVKFPESFSSEEVTQLKQVLPPGPQSQAPMSEDEPEQVTLTHNSRGLRQHNCSTLLMLVAVIRSCIEVANHFQAMPHVDHTTQQLYMLFSR